MLLRPVLNIFSFVSKKRKLLAISALVLSTGLAFQNCQNYGFQRFNTDALNSLSNGMTLENGASATNKKVLSVQFKQFKEQYTKVRFSLDGNFEKSQPVPFAQSLSFDLGDAWSQDGKKDGSKTVYAELNNASGLPLKLRATIGLDTIAPTLEAKGILKTGPSGRTYNLGEAANLEWNIADLPGPTHFSSGLDPFKGVRITQSLQADCSTVDKEILPWSAPRASFAGFKWPFNEPLKNFYVCIHGKDLAGNIATILSQPMISLWTVIAGDNNQGNGGSINAPNVRFKKPSMAELGSDGSLYIYDAHFLNIRKVSAADRTVNLFAGNGRTGLPNATDDIRTQPLSPVSMAIDSQDRIWFTQWGRLFVIEQVDGIGKAKLLNTYDPSCEMFIDIKKDAGKGDVLFGAGVCSGFSGEFDPRAKAAIFRIPVSELFSQAPQLKYSDLISKYFFTGNLSLPTKNQDFNKTIDIVGTPDAGNYLHSISYPTDIAVTSDETVIVTSRGSGNTPIWGKPMLRGYKKTADNTVTAFLIDGVVSWAHEIHAFNLTNDTMILTYGADSANQARAIHQLKFDGKIWKSTNRNAVDAPAFGTYLSSILPFMNNGSLEYYTLSVDHGRIFRLDQNLAIQETWGRAVFNDAEMNPVTSALNYPSGLAVAPDNSIYFFERYTSIIRKITPDGRLQFTGGRPFVNGTPDLNNEPLSTSTFNGNGLEFVKSSLTLTKRASDLKDVMYLTPSYPKVYEIDYQGGRASAKGQPKSENDYSDPINWRIFNTAKGNADSLLLARNYVYLTSPRRGFVTERKDGVEKTFIGSLDVTKPAKPGALKSEASLFAVHTVNQNGDFVFLTAQINEDGPTSFLWYDRTKEEAGVGVSLTANLPYLQDLTSYRVGNNIVLCGLNGGIICTTPISLNDLKTTRQIKVDYFALCMPGGFTNGPEDIEFDNQGNLVVSDSRNARILRYFTNNSGNFQTISQNAANCPK